MAFEKESENISWFIYMSTKLNNTNSLVTACSCNLNTGSYLFGLLNSKNKLKNLSIKFEAISMKSSKHPISQFIIYVLPLLLIVMHVSPVDAAIIYDESANTIYVSDENTNIPAIYATINDPNVISMPKTGEYLLNSNLIIEKDAVLTINDNDLYWLKINSTIEFTLNDFSCPVPSYTIPDSYLLNYTVTEGEIYHIWNNGTLNIDSVEISSWDTNKNAPAEVVTDHWNQLTTPRSYIVAAFGNDAHATITNSKLHHLGWSWGSVSVFWPYYTTKYPYYTANIGVNGQGELHPDHLIIDTGLAFYNSNDNYIVDNTIYSMKYGILMLDNSHNNIISNNVIYNTISDGIIFKHENDFNTIQNNYVYDVGGPGIELVFSSDNNTISDNYVSNSGASGIYLQAGNKYNEIYNNIVDYADGYGMEIYSGSSWNHISNNTITNTSKLGGAPAPGLEVRVAHYNIIESNTISNGRSDGIRLYYSSDGNVLNNNYISENGEEGIKICGRSHSSGIDFASDNTISNNIIENNNKNGIKLESALNNIINNNFISQNNGYGIYKDSTSTTNSIYNNVLSDNTLGLIYPQEDLSYATVSGYVRSSAGSIISGASVFNDVTPEIVTTDSSGYYTFTVPANIQVVVSAANEGYYSNTIFLNVGETDILNADLVLDSTEMESPISSGTTSNVTSIYGAALIDGDLNEWQNVAGISINGVSGRSPEEDNTALIKVMSDENYLYFALDVADTNLQATGMSESDALHLDDSVEIYIDTLNNGGTALQTDDYHFIINLNDAVVDDVGTGSGKNYTYASNILKSINIMGSKNSDIDIDTGYIIEVAIPWGDIGGMPSGEVIGLNIGINDWDDATDGRQYFDLCSLTGATNAIPDSWKDASIVKNINADSTIITISPTNQVVTPNQPFMIDFLIDPSVSIAGAQLDLLFNGQMVTVDSVTEGNLFTQNNADTLFNGGIIDNNAGRVASVYSLILGTSSVTSSGTMATISMNAGSSTGIAEFDLSNVIISSTNSNAVPFNVTKATVLVDTAPQFNSIPAKSGDEGSTLTFVVSATDVDGDDLTYSATSLPSGASFNANTGVFTWTPAVGNAGTYNARFEVTDGYLSDTVSVMIAVNELNNVPVITLFEPSNGAEFEEGSTIGVSVAASDADGQSLSYTIKVNGNIVSNSADYIWSTDYFSAGTYTITAVVSDGMGDVSSTHTITITDLHPRWDVNEDGLVNVLDLTMIAQNYGSTYTSNLPRWDVNQDGIVNVLDLSLLASHFGEIVA
ncbi:right-handed parallel beta-helix repeat-containing protein [Methanolobus sp. ZRKC3]|uniref:right-handed parallel beta-helix repeat-containing protein n=1 Tax=Methanolobus sp. ZRKC3 TaxID=3125786 RepID=UPI003251B837